MTEEPESPSGEHTRILRRLPRPPAAAPVEDTRTSIIRRTPTGSFPVSPEAPATTHIATPDAPATTHIETPAAPSAGVLPAATDQPDDSEPATPGPHTAVAACVAAMLSGWTTSLVATELIVGWWHTDRLFCVAVGFLALVFAVSTVSGVILLLLRRIVGSYLIAAGAVVALLAFCGVFIAGAKVPGIVYAMPVLPVLSAGFALSPMTRRWTVVR